MFERVQWFLYRENNRVLGWVNRVLRSVITSLAADLPKVRKRWSQTREQISMMIDDSLPSAKQRHGEAGFRPLVIWHLSRLIDL